MSSRPPLILVLEALQRIGVTDPIRCVGGGMAAIACVQGEGRYADRERFPYPTLIITDLEMAAGDGYALLLHLRTSKQTELAQSWCSVRWTTRSTSPRPENSARAPTSLVQPGDIYWLLMEWLPPPQGISEQYANVLTNVGFGQMRLGHADGPLMRSLRISTV